MMIDGTMRSRTLCRCGCSGEAVVRKAFNDGRSHLDFKLRILNVPENLGKLQANLTSLDLCENELSTIGEPVRSLTNLETLLLQSNQIEQMSLNELEGLQNLKILDMCFNVLGRGASFSPPLNSLTRLQKLYLNNNYLTDLPSLNLPNLRVLSLANNNLTSLRSIPPSLHELW